MNPKHKDYVSIGQKAYVLTTWNLISLNIINKKVINKFLEMLII